MHGSESCPGVHWLSIFPIPACEKSLAKSCQYAIEKVLGAGFAAVASGEPGVWAVQLLAGRCCYGQLLS